MKKLRVLFFILCTLAFAFPAQCVARAIPAHFKATVTPAPVHPGEIASVTVHASVDPGWHIYSVVPTPNGPSATSILSTGSWKIAAPNTENAPIRKRDPNFNAIVGYHVLTASFSRQFRVPNNASVSAKPLKITLHYQICNDKICLPPTDIAVSANASVAAGPVRPQFSKATPVAEPSVPAPVKTASSQSALWLFLLAALGGGLLAIFTPCVFPLIPITLTNFVKQAEGSQTRLVRLSVGYALGIVALYVALGAVVAALLQGRANNIAANPWVNLVEFALFVLFALSFFEAIQIRLPLALGNLQQSARKHSGTAGLVLLGVIFVLGSFTCTAPFVGTLLVSAAGGDWLRPLLGMTVFALAFASPFLILALFPQWIGRIPKGGAWLARVKGTLGFIELAAALKFLSNVDQVWQWKLLTQPVLLAAWAVIMICAALYLLGALKIGSEYGDEGPPSRLRKAFAALFAAAALYCFWGLANRPISPYLAAFLPPTGYGGVIGTNGEKNLLPWLSDYQTALVEAHAQHKRLLIDFTGYTCTNCRLNEKSVFPQASVQKQFAKYTRVQLYTDGAQDGANQTLQEDKFGDIALPLYGIIDPQTGAVVAQTEGVQNVAGFTHFLSTNVDSSTPTAKAWSAYSEVAITQAKVAGTPVVIDFTAAWCVNCKAIERTVFGNPSVAPILNSKFVTLRSDMTQWSAPANAALQKKYGFVSLPTVIFLGPDGKEIKSLRITGLLSAADFRKRMTAALAG